MYALERYGTGYFPLFISLCNMFILKIGPMDFHMNFDHSPSHVKCRVLPHCPMLLYLRQCPCGSYCTILWVPHFLWWHGRSCPLLYKENFNQSKRIGCLFWGLVLMHRYCYHCEILFIFPFGLYICCNFLEHLCNNRCNKMT